MVTVVQTYSMDAERQDRHTDFLLENLFESSYVTA